MSSVIKYGLKILDTTDSTSSISGSLQTSGGIGLSKSMIIGTSSVTDGISIKNGYNSSGNRQLWFTDSTFAANASNPVFRIGFNAGTAYIGSVSTDGNTNLPLYLTSPLTILNGIINLTNGTSNTIMFPAVGTVAPTFTTRSAGTRIVLWPTVNATNVDYAVGTESNGFWQSIPQNTATYQYKWYGGTTSIMTLQGGGLLRLNSNIADQYGHLIIDRPLSGGLGGTITIRNSVAGAVGNAAALAFELDNSTAFNADNTTAANAEIRCIIESANSSSALSSLRTMEQHTERE